MAASIQVNSGPAGTGTLAAPLNVSVALVDVGSNSPAPVSRQWAITAAPAPVLAPPAITGATTASAAFTPTVDGGYEVQLTRVEADGTTVSTQSVLVGVPNAAGFVLPSPGVNERLYGPLGNAVVTTAEPVATTVASGSNTVALSTLTGTQSLSVASTVGMPSSGFVYFPVHGSAIVSYTGVSGGNTLTNCKLLQGSGTLATNDVVATSIALASLAGSSVVPVVSTVGLPTAGHVSLPYIGNALISYTGVTSTTLTGCALVAPATTTVALLSNNLLLSTLTGGGTINVAATAGAPSAGQLVFPGHGGAVVSYTGLTSTTFTGCRLLSGSGTLATNDVVTAAAVLLAGNTVQAANSAAALAAGWMGSAAAGTNVLLDAYLRALLAGAATVAPRVVTSGPDTVSIADAVVSYNGSVAISANLPAGALCSRKTLKNTGTADVTVVANGSDHIFSSTTVTQYVIPANGASIDLVWEAANARWLIV